MINISSGMIYIIYIWLYSVLEQIGPWACRIHESIWHLFYN